MLYRAHTNLVVKFLLYDIKMDVNFVLDWIYDMEKFFQFESTFDNSKVRIAVTRFEGHQSGGSICKLIKK